MKGSARISWRGCTLPLSATDRPKRTVSQDAVDYLLSFANGDTLPLPVLFHVSRSVRRKISIV